MNHLTELKSDLEQEPAPQGQESSGFLPVSSIILVAIKYALKNAWNEKDRADIKASILELWDTSEIDSPIIDGVLETIAKKVIRSLLVVILDQAL